MEDAADSSTMTPKQLVAQEWLEWHDQTNATSKLDAVIMCSLLDDPRTRDEARKYLNRWRRECLSSNGAKEIIRDGGDCELPFLKQLVR